jgi:hypothetical protein
MTTAASIGIQARICRMHGKIIIGMELSWARAAIVASGTIVFFMAIRAEFRIVRCHRAMASQKVSIMRGIAQPLRREQLPGSKDRLQFATAGGAALQVASFTSARRVAVLDRGHTFARRV